MNLAEVKIECDQLSATLERLARLQEDLHGAVTAKLEAMRLADVPSMLDAQRREAELLTAVECCDAERNAIVPRLCQLLSMSGRSNSLRHIVAKIPGALGQELTERGARLRERMLRVAEANRVVEIVCREMLSHFRNLFAALLNDETGASGYGRGGKPGQASGALLVDAIG